VTYPTDATTAVEEWMQSQRDLQFLLDEAVQHPGIAPAIEEAGLSAAEARAAVLENPTVVNRLRAARDPSRTLRMDRVPGSEWGVSAPYLADATPLARISVAGLGLGAYLVLMMAPGATTMPWPAALFAFLGLLATGGLAVMLAGEDALAVLNARRNAQDQATWRRSVLAEIVLPELRQFVEERREPSYDTTLAIRGLHNLYQDDEDAPIIITASGQHLRRVLARSTSDAIAIAGPRGAGKTTSIRAAARGLLSDPGAPPPMQVIASAPSRYEARDFVLHLHAVLAKQVIELTDRLLGRRTREHDRVPNPRGRLERAARWLFRKIVIPAALVTGAWLLWDKPFPEFLEDVRAHFTDAFTNFPTNIGVVLPTDSDAHMFAVAMLLVAPWPLIASVLRVVLTLPVQLLSLAFDPDARTGAKKELTRLGDAARHQLDRIRFLQTYTSGWSGKLAIPLGSDLGWARGGQRVEQQLTHPEVIEKFREFAAWSAEVLLKQGAIERIVIAIDELDKIADADKAHEFVNDVKGIFGIEGCLFLVAVSDDAIAAFERRGIPVRDAFDSAFSEMIRMDAFTIAESRRWMSRRLLGVPEPFGYLCHCMSGGLPRDLRRSTIDMIDAVRETGTRDLESVAAVMVERELDRKAHAFAAAARRLDDSAELTAYLADLLVLRQVRQPGELVVLAGRLAPREDSTIPRVRWQSACFVLFCATIREVFTNDLDESDLDKGVELLGTARTQLAVDPHVAWHVVNDVRARYGCVEAS
jgi:hypothetical protein